LKIVFAGTPDFAAYHLQALLDNQFDVAAVYTQPDRPAGRGKKLMASPVKQLAQQHDIAVYQPLNFKDQADIDALAALKPDLLVVVAYGLLLPQAVLDIPTFGCINSHASLLPRWRGAAPIQRALEAGDNLTGVTVMQMEAGLDTGPMLHKVETPIMPSDTGGTLHDRLMELGAQAVVDTIPQIERNQVAGRIQDDSEACYAHKLSKEEALINWDLPADAIVRKIRAFNPFPMCFTLLGDNRIRVLSAQVYPKNHYSMAGTILSVNNMGIMVAAKEHAVVIESVQLPGKKPMKVADMLNGKHPFQENYLLASEL